MSTEIPFLAIDFGTSFSKIAWFNPKSAQAEIIHTGDGEEKMPSVVFYGDDTEWGKLVGKAADEVLEDYGHDPEVAGRLVDSVKRALLDPPVIALPGGRSVTPVAVVADLLGRLKHDAETRLFHGPVTRAVITHPAVFDPQQQVIRRGAETAGFTQVELVPEPVAAALAFAQAGHKVGDGVLVYDLGAGTFDLAVLARRPGGGFYVPMPVEGDRACGGDDFDWALYDYCDAAAQRQFGRGLAANGQADARFLRQCRKVKENLSRRPSVPLSAVLGGQQHFSLKLERAEFERLIADRVDATVRQTAEMVKRAGAAGHAVDTVVLIGGAARVPMILDKLRQTLHPLVPLEYERQDVAVALGAAWHGAAGTRSTRSAPPADSHQPRDQEAGQGEARKSDGSTQQVSPNITSAQPIIPSASSLATEAESESTQPLMTKFANHMTGNGLESNGGKLIATEREVQFIAHRVNVNPHERIKIVIHQMKRVYKEGIS